MPNQKPVDDNLFDWPSSSPRLWGSRCALCGNVSFPVAQRCSRCSHDQQDRFPLSTEGTLWSWTVQRFPPASPPFPPSDGTPFEPFPLGYVELPGEVRVISRLFYNTKQTPHIGQNLKLAFEHLYCDTDGTEIIGYGFTPHGDTK